MQYDKRRRRNWYNPLTEYNRVISKTLKGRKHKKETVIKNRLSHSNRWNIKINGKKYKRNKKIISWAEKAVEELIKVAKEKIVDSDDDVSADRLKNAAATKKLAIFDAFEILQRIQQEEDMLNEKPKEVKEQKTFRGFAEGRSK